MTVSPGNDDGARKYARTNIILARHGETEFNVRRVFRGRADPPLDALGLDQVRLQGDAIAELGPERIFSSPRLRATQTAEAIARACGKRLETDPELDDIDYGEWTGQSHEQVATRWPEDWQAFLERPETLTFPRGEHMGGFVARLRKVWLRHDGREGTTVLVTHDVVIRTLVCILLNAPLSAMHRLRIDVASTTCISSNRHEPSIRWLNRTYQSA